jgi:hypothetical protein
MSQAEGIATCSFPSAQYEADGDAKLIALLSFYCLDKCSKHSKIIHIHKELSCNIHVFHVLAYG